MNRVCAFVVALCTFGALTAPIAASADEAAPATATAGGAPGPSVTASEIAAFPAIKAYLDGEVASLMN